MERSLEIGPPVPAAGWDFGDAILTVPKIFPKLGGVGGARKTARPADDGFFHFSIRKSWMTMASSPEVQNTATASSTEWMIGFPITLKLVLRSMGMPVMR